MTYNEIMQKAGKRINTSIYYTYNGETVTIGKDDIKQAKPFFNASLIGTVMKGFSAETKSSLPLNTAIYFKNTASYGGNSATQIYGPYYLKEEGQFNADTKTYSHSLYDSFITTMVDYVPITMTYPTTVLGFFQRLCVECGFTTNISSLPNGSRVIGNDIYDGINFTFRDVFDDIGKATGTLFALDALEVKKCELGTTTITINDDILKNQNIEFGQHFGPINSIVLSRSADSDNIYKRDETLTSWNEFKISDCQLMNDNNRTDYLDELYTALYGIEYDIFDLELIGFGVIDPLQKAQIVTGGKTYNSYVFNNDEIFTQGYAQSIYTELPEETSTNYKTSDTTDRRISQAYIMVDKQNQQIEAVTSTVATIDTRENNNYQQLLAKFDDYTPASDFINLESSVTQLQTDTYTKTEINTKLTDGSVTMVSTTSGTFDENGLTIEKTNAKSKGRFNETGVTVMDATGSSEEELLFAGYDEALNESVVRTKNINVTKYLSIGTKSRIEDYEDGTGIFYVG